MTAPRIVLIASILGLFVTPAHADVFLRWNQAGFRPDQPKSLVAMSDEDLAGQTWRIVGANSEAILEGSFGASVVGAGDHTPLPFNHVVDFTSLRDIGEYRFLVEGAKPALIRVAANPYESLLQLPLRHLRVMRSGSPHTLLRETSHLGDADTPIFVPDGDPADGEWKPSENGARGNALGGWYDAGDQIKFTLNNAYTTYHLLYAYNLQPRLFTTIDSPTDLPDILDEAWHGLEFLMRTFPDENTFIVQVGDEEDHEQPRRLPEHDALDGKRPAMCALSRTHMASTVAALALGSRTFDTIGKSETAVRLRTQAIRIYERALGPDTIQTAFERGHVNDFYHDTTEADQMALAAFELYSLTGRESYLKAAIAYVPPAATEVSWRDWNWLPNSALAKQDPEALERLHAETSTYTTRAKTTGVPWGIPGRYVWGSLPRWIGAANAARTASRESGPLPDHDALFFSMLDYTFGRNNWGVSFLFSESLPNTVRNIYSPAYHLLNEFPTGALSEGPGNKDTHDAMQHYFNDALAGLDFVPDKSLDRFNTEAGVFSDSPVDFMTQEATITAQADILLMLTLASLEIE